MKKLGIVLPTYNRCQYAKEGVENLLPQLLNNRENVCLLITDNASSDDTEKLLRPYSEKYPEIIEYVRQKNNIGPHANFYYGIKYLNTDYIYLLGDDDLVSPYFVLTILHLLETYPDVGMIHFNYLEGHSDLKRVEVHKSSVSDNSLCKRYQNGKNFVKDMLISPSFISSDVFKKECMLKGIEANYHEDCYGYDWLVCLYTGVLERQCIYYELPLVVQRYGEAYAKFALNTILGQQRVFDYLDDYVPGISNIWKDIASKQGGNMTRVIRSICGNKSLYQPYYDDLRKCLKNPIHRFSLFMALYFPTFLSKNLMLLMMAVYKGIKVFHRI